MGWLKQIIIGVCLIAAIAFMGISIISTWEIFRLLINTDQAARGELWVLLVLAFTGGVILLSIAWGIAEMTESRRAQREILRDRGPVDEDV